MTPTRTTIPTATGTASAEEEIRSSTLLGVQVFPSDTEPEALQRLRDAELRFARLQADWQFIEPLDRSPPLYQFDFMDAQITALVADGFTPIVNIVRNPSWAATTTCGPVDKVPMERFGKMVGELVERFDGDGIDDAPGSPRVAYWEIGNEQDYDLSRGTLAEGIMVGSCFGGSSADAYGEHLRTAYGAVKTADPSGEVIFGSLAYDRLYNGPSGHEPTGPFDRNLTRSALEYLYDEYPDDPAFPFFDLIGIHVFNDFRNNWDGIQPVDQELIGKLDYFRDDQLQSSGRFDLRDARIAVTEVALPSMPSDAFTTRSESLQAIYPGQVLARGMAAGAEMIVWFSAEDHRSGSGCEQRHLYEWLAYGLLRSQEVYDAIQQCDPIPGYLAGYQVDFPHQPKPSLTAAMVASEQLARSNYERQLTNTETGSAQIEAHRFVEPDGTRVIVAFTDSGERIGRNGTTPPERTMAFGAFNVPGWSGDLLLTDHLGNQEVRSGTVVFVDLTQEPIFARPAP